MCEAELCKDTEIVRRDVGRSTQHVGDTASYFLKQWCERNRVKMNFLVPSTIFALGLERSRVRVYEIITIRTKRTTQKGSILSRGCFHTTWQSVQLTSKWRFEQIFWGVKEENKYSLYRMTETQKCYWIGTIELKFTIALYRKKLRLLHFSKWENILKYSLIWPWKSLLWEPMLYQREGTMYWP